MILSEFTCAWRCASVLTSITAVHNCFFFTDVTFSPIFSSQSAERNCCCCCLFLYWISEVPFKVSNANECAACVWDRSESPPPTARAPPTRRTRARTPAYRLIYASRDQICIISSPTHGSNTLVRTFDMLVTIYNAHRSYCIWHLWYQQVWSGVFFSKNHHLLINTILSARCP